MSSLLRWGLPGLLAISLLGCDLVGTPERFVDPSVRPPVVAAVNFTDLRDGQHLAGPVSFTVNLDSLGDRVDYAQLSVDGEPASTCSGHPCTFALRTDEYPEGPATLGLEVYERDRSTQGLLGLVGGAPSLALYTPVVFDQSPPTPVANLRAAWGGDGVTLTWAPNVDANFYAYVVIREDTWSGVMDPATGIVGQLILDTLYTAPLSVYRDPSPPAVYGLRSTYRVEVTNRAVTTESPGTETVFGTPVLRDDGGLYSRALYGNRHPSRDLAYTIQGSILQVLSTQTGADVGAVDLADHIETPELVDAAYVVGIHPDGTELYVYATDPATVDGSAFLVFSATEQPALLRRLPHLPPSTWSVRVGPPGRLLGWVDDQLRLLDATDGRIAATLSDVPAGAHVQMLPGTVLLAQHLSPAGQCVFATFDLGGNAAQKQAETTHPFDGQDCGAVLASPDGQSLYVRSVMDNSVRVLDAATLQTTWEGVFPVSDGNLVDGFTAVDSRLYFWASGGAAPFPQSTLVEMDGNLQAILRTWRFAGRIDGAAGSADGVSLLVFSYDPSRGNGGAMWRLNLSE